MKAAFSILTAAVLSFCAAFAQLPTDCSQAVLGIADGWNSSTVSLSLVEKQPDGRWARVLGPIPGRLGRTGLAWGLGVHSNPRGVTIKREGDGRSPAGVFLIGGLWTTNKTPIKHHRRIPEVRVGPCDLWVSDPSQPRLYNRHIRLNHPAATPGELKEQMRQTDYAHSIKLLICHNTWETPGRPIAGAGSSIFFHIWCGSYRRLHRHSGSKPAGHHRTPRSGTSPDVHSPASRRILPPPRLVASPLTLNQSCLLTTSGTSPSSPLPYFYAGYRLCRGALQR